jgi:hypothetical protein
MRGVLPVLAVGLLLAQARADVAPPKGTKRVVLDHKITTEKEFPDYEFFTVVGAEQVKAVKLDPKNPVVIAGAGRNGRFRLASIVAVPKDAGKAYESEAEFHKAVASGRVKGLRARSGFDPFLAVKDGDTRTSVTAEYVLEIDPKEGIVLKPAGPPKSGSAPGKPEEPEDEVSAAPGGRWLAGALASAGVLLAGLWLANRARR